MTDYWWQRWNQRKEQDDRPAEYEKTLIRQEEIVGVNRPPSRASLSIYRVCLKERP